MRYRIHSMILDHEWSDPKEFGIIAVLEAKPGKNGTYELTVLVEKEW